VEQAAGPACRWAAGAGDRVLSGDGPTRWAAPCRRGRGALGGRGLYFTGGAGTRKARNLAANPASTISVKLEGIDLVLEGEATRATDWPTLERVAERYRENGWPAEVEGEAFTAPFSPPSAGPPPWQLYCFILHTAFGVASAEPYGATPLALRDAVNGPT
jgi:hypothetical protein